MDAAEYKHVVLGLIFLNYISDSFEEQHAKLVAGKANTSAPIPRILANTASKTSFGSRQLRVGLISKTTRSSRQLAKLSMTR